MNSNVNEEDYKRFKNLLEYFVAHSELRANNLKYDVIKNELDNPKWKILIEGFEKSGNVEFAHSGQGRKGQNIQNQINNWDNYKNEGKICISIDGTKRNGGYLLHWNIPTAKINIAAEWEGIIGKDITGGSVTSLKITYNGEDKHIKHTLDELGLFNNEEPNECLKSFFNSYIKLKMTLTDILAKRLEKAKNLILTGAPGTGKTYIAKKIAEKIVGKDNKNTNIGFVQFHPSYDYSDFVEGLRPVKNNSGDIAFERKDGIFKEFCKRAINKKEESFVFIIDEINRGELSKIFGELFYSIDPGYRGEEGKVCTQYQNLINSDDTFNQGFYIPDNVYIIGTMNDIDRSIESMDFAMRRRFAFIEIKADDRTDMWNDKDNGLNIEQQAVAEKLMTSLNNEISKIPGLGAAYHIGPSYFLKLKDNSKEELWDYYLKGLLLEYLRGMPDADERLNDLENAYNDSNN